MQNSARLRGATAVTAFLAVSLLGSGHAAADQVIPDDLIVQGSICTGFDCVNNESFDFDTIILKENNLRILFLDTSAGTFPANDWRLIANDSGDGGASFFAIEDATAARQIFRVAAGAPANSIFVDSSGRVGFRTSTPVLDLHARTGNTPAIRLEQDASAGFAAQTWDIAGNEANFFVRDVTAGSRMPFRIRPGAPTSSLDIAASGNVGIGTASPQQNLHVRSSGNTALLLETAGTTPAKWIIFSRASDGNLLMQDANGNKNPIQIAPGSPTSAIEIGPNNIRLSQVPNCTAGIRTNANGVLSCLPPAGPMPRGLEVPGQARIAAVASSGSAAVLNSGSQEPSTSSDKDGQAGCNAEDLAGNWSLIATSVEKFGDGSVLWCDVELAPTGQGSFAYNASGQCRNHEPNELKPQTTVLSARGTIAGTAACRFSGGLEIKQGRAVVATAAIVEGRIEGTGARKTRAVGVSRVTRGRSNAMQTLMLQR